MCEWERVSDNNTSCDMFEIRSFFVHRWNINIYDVPSPPSTGILSESVCQRQQQTTNKKFEKYLHEQTSSVWAAWNTQHKHRAATWPTRHNHVEAALTRCSRAKPRRNKRKNKNLTITSAFRFDLYFSVIACEPIRSIHVQVSKVQNSSGDIFIFQCSQCAHRMIAVAVLVLSSVGSSIVKSNLLFKCVFGEGVGLLCSWCHSAGTWYTLLGNTAPRRAVHRDCK